MGDIDTWGSWGSPDEGGSSKGKRRTGTAVAVVLLLLLLGFGAIGMGKEGEGDEDEDDDNAPKPVPVQEDADEVVWFVECGPGGVRFGEAPRQTEWVGNYDNQPTDHANAEASRGDIDRLVSLGYTGKGIVSVNADECPTYRYYGFTSALTLRFPNARIATSRDAPYF